MHCKNDNQATIMKLQYVPKLPPVRVQIVDCYLLVDTELKLSVTHPTPLCHSSPEFGYATLRSCLPSGISRRLFMPRKTSATMSGDEQLMPDPSNASRPTDKQALMAAKRSSPPYVVDAS